MNFSKYTFFIHILVITNFQGFRGNFLNFFLIYLILSITTSFMINHTVMISAVTYKVVKMYKLLTLYKFSLTDKATL